MPFDFNTFVASSVLTAIAACAKPLIDWYRARRDATLNEKKVESQQELALNDQENKQSLALTEQAFELYKELVTTLTKNVEKLNENVQTLQDAHAKCQEENASLRAEIQSLRDKVEQLSEQLKRYETLPPAC